jgi:hypothetical protein
VTLTLDRAAPAVDDMLVFARSRLIKAAQPSVKQAQQDLFADVTDGFAGALASYFKGFAERALPVAKAVLRGFDPDDIDWDFEEGELTELIGTWYARVGRATYEIVSGELGVEIDWSLNGRGVKRVMGKIGRRVKDVTDVSRQALRVAVATGIERGYSIEQLVAGVGDDGFRGLTDLVASWASTTDDAQSRAQTIALTETATAYSLSSTAAYRDSGLVNEVEVLDGPECGWESHDDPDLADGSRRTLDEADEYPVAHPNCQRAFAPTAAR